MKRLMNSSTPWPCRLKALDLQNRFHFQTREVARKTLNIASLQDMKVTVPVNVLLDRIRGGTGSSAINDALVDQEEMKGRLAKRPSHLCVPKTLSGLVERRIG
jgi:hypothetical protein